MFEHITRPYHFIMPILIVLVGSAVMLWGRSDVGTWAGLLIWAIAMLQTLWLAVAGIITDLVGYLRERLEYDEKEKELQQEAVAKDVLKVEVDRGEMPGDYNRSYHNLTVSPQKMLIIAQACLNGSPFSTRVWSGKNRLMSDPEFRVLQDELLELGAIIPRSEKDDRLGYLWTDFGKQLLEECVRDAIP